MRVPSATYRLQLNGEFRFADAAALVPYLHDLGITDIYASPVLKARRGSLHGYDVTDPSSLNPELGTEHDFDRLSQSLKQKDMGMLLDIVPNHMAASPENPWWRDLQDKGKDSEYAGYFDTDWLAFGDIDNCPAGHRRFFDIGITEAHIYGLQAQWAAAASGSKTPLFSRQLTRLSFAW